MGSQVMRECSSPEEYVQGHKGRESSACFRNIKEVWFGQKEKQRENMKVRKDAKGGKGP